MSSYTIEIDMPKEVEATVSPTKLEFTKLKENQTFTISLSWKLVKLSMHREVSSGSLASMW